MKDRAETGARCLSASKPDLVALNNLKLDDTGECLLAW